MQGKKVFESTLFCLVFALPALAVWNLVRTHHTFMVFSDYLSGKAGTCTIAESLEGEALARLQSQNVGAIRSASRVVRTDERFSLWDTPEGEFWVPTPSGGPFIYDLGEQKRNIYGTRIGRGDIVLDVGANVGVFTRKALWAGAAKVIAIEPAPENLECLRRTFAAEITAGRVVVYAKGAWDKDDVLKFAVDPNNSARDSFVRRIENPQFIQVPVTTIDKIAQELGFSRLDFIKMDIEGAEQQAIVGAKDTIARFRPRMALCIYHLEGDDKAVPRLVAAVVPGYKVSKTCLLTLDRIQPEVAFFY